MSLLVDYASSSEDEAASVPASPAPARAPPAASNPSQDPASSSTDAAAPKAPQKLKKKVIKKKKKAKTKTTLYLPPEIQRLLESGTLSDDSDDDNELLAKHKKAKKAASKRPRPTDDADSVLSFLPPPKHDLPAPKVEAIISEQEEKNKTQEAAIAATATGSEARTGQPVDEQAANAAAWQQYYQQQQYQAADGFYVAQGEDDVPGGSSKRRRTRERDVERALQQGHFETVAEQITDVQGPSRFGWQPPVDPTKAAGGSSEQEVKVKASFWNAQAGTTVSSMKPSRLQRAKHQLNQLAFDAKARDFELLDKRSASLKTKRETYAKYGW